MPSALSVRQVKRFYDRFGRLQDSQLLFEGAALRGLAGRGRFGEAQSVFEFGCGAGAFPEARRLLTADGLLWVASLEHGATPLARFLNRLWTSIQAVRPSLVGGCRPIEVRAYLSPEARRIAQHSVVIQCGVSSEVVVAVRN